MESINLTDVIVALVAGYLAYIQTKKSKEPETQQNVLTAYNDLYALVEKQRDKQILENEKQQEQIEELKLKLSEFETLEKRLKNIIEELTGMEFRDYIKKLEEEQSND